MNSNFGWGSDRSGHQLFRVGRLIDSHILVSDRLKQEEVGHCLYCHWVIESRTDYFEIQIGVGRTESGSCITELRDLQHSVAIHYSCIERYLVVPITLGIFGLVVNN